MANTVPSVVFYYFDGQRSNGFPKSSGRGGLTETFGRRENDTQIEALSQFAYRLDQGWKVPGSLTGTTTGQQNHDSLIAGKSVTLQKLRARRLHLNQGCERMSYICCIDAPRPEPLFFKGKKA